MINNLLAQLEYFLADRGIYMLIFILMALGVFGMIACNNYIKKVISMNILQVSIIFFFLTFGQKNGATLPVIVDNIFSASAYINPVPHALMLTAIVVSLGTTGVALGLLMKIRDIYGTLDEDKIAGMKGEQK